MTPDTPDTPEIKAKRIELKKLDVLGKEGDPDGMNETQLDIAIGEARWNSAARPKGP
jgi:hypothetical protein